MPPRAYWAEAIGSFLLFAAVIGSGIMAQRLAGGNGAIALLANMLATGAMLFVLITLFGPVSGAHLNPAVTLVARLRGEMTSGTALGYAAAQLGGGVAGVWAAHLMFGAPVLELSRTARHAPGLWLGEGVATFGLILTILGSVRARPAWTAPCVALYIGSAYWFTSSTSFANPAITLARSLSDSFAGIAPGDVPPFVLAQFAGALLGWLAGEAMFEPERGREGNRA